MASSGTTLLQMDERFHVHPFTNHDEMHVAGTNIIVAGEGVYVRDNHGRKLLDGLAGLWCVNVGYGREEIVEAVTAQMRQLAFYPSFFNSTTEPAIRLSERLAQLAPPRLNHTVFCGSGSEANETALKIIRAYWKLKGQPHRTKILSRTFSYHGVTIATTSMTGLPSCYQPFDLPLPGFIHVPGPHAYAANQEHDPVAYGQWCVKETARMIDQEGADTVAAMFVEPVQGAGGVIPPPAGYLSALRQLCRDQGILFVADEVITGFGRIGDWFASGRWEIDPDLITMAKGLSSGYVPLGGTMLSDEIADLLLHSGYFAHGFTYTGHPVSCAAGLASLDILDREDIPRKVRTDIGPYFQEKLRSFAGHRAVGEVRGTDLIGAIELVPPGGKAALTPGMLLGVKAAALAREEGVIVRGIRDLIAIAPPLTINRAEIDELFAAIGRALERMPS